ncbi:MAG TPA: amidohydrolase family protein [Solirubrobacteraceae bacterium]|jgi:aminocarboxymuconate-semialdehyde decarboxylase
MNAIDVHAHVIVPELLRDSAPAETWRPSVRWEGGRQIVELGGRRISSAVREFVELDIILATQERAGIERVVLCPWVPLLFYEVDADEGMRRCRLQNDGLMRLRREYPDRVSVLGAVPLQEPEAASAELERLMGSGAFAGVEIAASVRGTYLGDARFEPFWAAAARTGALVFVHPTTQGLDISVLRERYLWNLLGNPFETTIAAAHLVLAGVLERHPDANVLLAHAGGAIVSLGGRLRHGAETIADAGARLTEPADVSVGRFLFDTITHDPAQLRALVEAVGAERVLLGSDYPFDMADPDPVGTVRAAGLDRREQEALLAGNAERLLGLGGAATG